jgi:hypothetical protein
MTIILFIYQNCTDDRLLKIQDMYYPWTRRDIPFLRGLWVGVVRFCLYFPSLYSLCCIGVVLNIRIVTFVLFSSSSWSWSYFSWIYNYLCNQ